jgi:CBS-domain-containing membrane protein
MDGHDERDQTVLDSPRHYSGRRRSMHRPLRGLCRPSDQARGLTAMYRFLESTAGQYMTPAIKSVTRQCSMAELETLFKQHDFDALPVVEGGSMLGIVTKFDFLRMFAFTTGQMVPRYDELMKRTVGDVMTEAVVHVEPATPLTRVLQLMVNLKIRSFPVLGPNRQMLGVISRGDVMRALKQHAPTAR